jgi:chemotaxis-related protein WspD
MNQRQRPLPPGYLQEWAEHFRQPELEAANNDRSVMAFRLGAEWLGLDTSLFSEVAPLAPIHRMPHRKARGMAGIVNVSGRLLPAVALPDLLGTAPDPAHAVSRRIFPRLLVMEWESRSFAFAVDELHGIVRFSNADVQPPAATIGKGSQHYLTGVLAQEDMHIGLLDAGLLGYQFERMLR